MADAKVVSDEIAGCSRWPRCTSKCERWPECVSFNRIGDPPPDGSTADLMDTIAALRGTCLHGNISVRGVHGLVGEYQMVCTRCLSAVVVIDIDQRNAIVDRIQELAESVAELTASLGLAREERDDAMATLSSIQKRGHPVTDSGEPRL